MIARATSGEDWKNVALTLTTALPAADVATPQISSLFLDLQVPVPPRLDALNGMSAKRSAIAQVASAPAPFGGIQEVTTSARRVAAASSTDYIAEYKTPSRVSLSVLLHPKSAATSRLRRRALPPRQHSTNPPDTDSRGRRP